MVGLDQVVALVERDRGEEALPGIREYRLGLPLSESQSSSALRSVKSLLSTSSETRPGCVSAQASASVLPQDLPNTSQRSMLTPWRSSSRRYFAGSNSRRRLGCVAPPSPPCKKTAGLPLGFPEVSQ